MPGDRALVDRLEEPGGLVARAAEELRETSTIVGEVVLWHAALSTTSPCGRKPSGRHRLRPRGVVSVLRSSVLSRTLAVAVLLPLALAAPRLSARAPEAPPPEETRISLDFKDADVLDVVRLMAEVGRFQVVADSGPACRLTRRLERAPLAVAFDTVLRACGLGSDEHGGIVRVAPVARLSAEQAERRRLGEEQRLNRPLYTRSIRLSYAQAAELAPLVKRHLSPRGEVAYDTRTNTLFVTDVE